MGYLYMFISAFVIAYMAGVAVIIVIKAYRSRKPRKGKGYSHFNQMTQIYKDEKMLKAAKEDMAAKKF